MINVSPSDACVALGGVFAGLVIGSLDNIRKTGSLFKIGDKNRQNDVFHQPTNTDSKNVSWLNSLEAYREKAIDGKNLFFDPCIPLEQVLPLTLVGIHHIIKSSRSPEATGKSLIALSANYTFKVILLPLAYNLILVSCSNLVRMIFIHVTESMGIDPSGHFVVQLGSAAHKIVTFSALSQMGISSNLYRLTASVTSLLDGMWVYRTVSVYHSVMDMVAGAFFMGISCGAFYKFQPVILNQVSRVVTSASTLDIFKKIKLVYRP